MMTTRGRKWVRLGLAVALIAIVGWVARPTSVAEVSVPSDLLAAKYMTAADHTDAYRSDLKTDHFRDVEQLSRFSAFSGRRIEVNQYEIVFQSSLLGLEIYRSFQLQRPRTNRPSFTVATAIHSTGFFGGLSLLVVRPVHRFVTPWMVQRMVARATAAA